MQLPVTCVDGAPRLATVYHLDRGLAIQKDVQTNGQAGLRWAVLHIASGLLVSGRLRTRAQARALQQQLLGLEIDWTKKATKTWLKQVHALALPVVRGETAPVVTTRTTKGARA